MPYKNRIKTLEESIKLIDKQIDQLEKETDLDFKKINALHQKRTSYESELRKFNRQQFEEETERVEFDDDR